MWMILEQAENLMKSIASLTNCKRLGQALATLRPHSPTFISRSDLASKALSPSMVCDKPKINNSCTSELKLDKESKENLVKCLFPNNFKEDCGDILIQGLWAHSTACIIDIHIADVDAKSNHSKAPEKVLAAHENEKIRNTSSHALGNELALLSV
jgi:hypothetical protein